MARRKDHSPQQLTDLTIAAVISFMAQHPINQLSLRGLAKIVGYSPGTLLNLFGSYNKLLLQVSGFTLGQIQQQLAVEVTSTDTNNSPINPTDSIVAIANSYLNFAQQAPYQWQQVFEHRLDSGQEIPPLHQQQITELFQLIEPLLAQLAPLANANTILIASRTLWASVHGICMMSIEDKLFTPASVTSDTLINSLVTHYLKDWVSNNQ